MKELTNKFIIIIATIIMIFSISTYFNTVNATNDNITDNPTFYVEGGETQAGYNIYVPVYMESVKGISAADVKILYYKELEFVKFEEIQGGMKNVVASVNKDNGEIVLAFSNDTDITGIVPIGNLIFKVPENAEPYTSYDVLVGEVNKIVSKEDGELVGYYAGNSSIKVINPLEVEENMQTENKNTNKKKIIIICVSISMFVIIIISILVYCLKNKKRK